MKTRIKTTGIASLNCVIEEKKTGFVDAEHGCPHDRGGLCSML
jgi:hypothetical protein